MTTSPLLEIERSGFTGGRSTCSLSFRRLIWNDFPRLGEDAGFARLMQHLLFSTHHGGESIPLCAKTLAVFFESTRAYKNKTYRAETDLVRFRERVLPQFSWHSYSAEKQKCRSVRDRGLPIYVENALERELSTPVKDLEHRVYFDTGKPFSKATQRRERQALQERVQQRREASANAVQERILDYLNGLNPSIFAGLRKNLAAAIEEARQIPEQSKRHDALRRLRSLQELSGRPLYGPSEDGQSVRLWEVGETFVNLSKPVRRVLNRGWSEFDLRSSQLAINARAWEVAPLLDFLQDGGDIWRSLFYHLGLGDVYDDPLADIFATYDDVYNPVKKALKTALYALQYGARPASIKNGYWEGSYRKPGLDETLNRFLPSDTSATDCFLSHPLIKSLLTARKRVHDATREAGGLTDCFGTFIEATTAKQTKSALSLVAQATEMMLLLPALELAEATDDFHIVLWQHDGFSVSFRRSKDRDRLTSRIQEAVDIEAERLQIPTRLEVEHL